MAYVGFDLDETLGRFSTAHYHTLFLQPHIVVYEGVWSGLYGSRLIPPPIPLSPTLKSLLDNAFSRFVSCVASKEAQDPPLGLIRPSMVDLIQRLKALKDEGEVKAVVIYSNNGNLSLLHLAGQVLETLTNAPGLFCNYIHWYHPFREREVRYGAPGNATKSLAILKKAFQTGLCTPAEIPHDKIYFFDDLDPPHYDLYSELEERYIQLEPYKFDAPFEPLDECFVTVLRESGLLESQEYFEYIAPIIGNNKSLQGILNVINQDKLAFRRKMIKPNNTRLTARTLQMFPKRTSRANFMKALQTVRKLEEKQNQGSVLNETQQQILSTAQGIVTAYESEHPNSGGSFVGPKHPTIRKNRKTKKHRKH